MIHEHVHTRYSFLDGFSSPEAIIKRVKELGMDAIAITDHNSLAGIWHFQQTCIKEGVKPLLGLEAYWTWDTEVLSKSADERHAIAMANALAAGVEIPAKIDGKKTTKKQINELIKDYAYDTKQYHILFLAMNQEGWKNLTRIQSESSEKCTYNGRFCCDTEMIRKYNKGLIMTSACIGNVLSSLIRKGRLEQAERILDEWHEIFGDRFYLEIQPLNIDKQWITNLQYIKWAKEKQIEIIATNDVHYANKEDWDDHDTLLCIGTGKLKADEDRMKYDHEFWIRSEEEMYDAFAEQLQSMLNAYDNSPMLQDFKSELDIYDSIIEKAINNTHVVADRINIDIKLGSDVDLFPNIDVPNGLTAEEHLTNLCYKSLYKYYAERDRKINLRLYEKRLSEELGIVNGKGFAPYILTVWDIINWCDRNEIPVGPGRGSAAGALVLFLLGITKGIDPIEYQLLFFRFLTADRTAPPDIDTDFSYLHRQDVIRYLEEKYGHENVSGIGTYTTMGVKSGLKDVGRVLNIPFNIMNDITKQIDEITDEEPSIKFKDIDNLANFQDDLSVSKFKQWTELQEKYQELFRLARVFEGTPRNMGVHASGVLVTPMPVSDLFPTRTVDGKQVTLYTGPQLEEAKAIKIDILGLKTLDVMNMTLKSIDESLRLNDVYKTICKNDVDVYNMICDRDTEGLFQIESNLFKSIIKDMQPTSMNDIIALTSIGRPGPLQAGMHTAYNNRKNGLEEAVEPLPNTWDIVQDTYGTIIYQEQIMLIAKRVAGFDDNQTDSYLRKALAKKQRAKMDICKQWFIYGKRNEKAPQGYDEENLAQPMYDPNGKHGPAVKGGIANGYDEQQLIDFWNTMEGYATYLFNKSHAACYSLITNITAELKNKQVAKFYASLLSMEKKEEKIELYIKMARKAGVKVMTPHINESNANFIEKNGTILFGFGKIKGVGDTSIPDIIKNAPYTSLQDMIDRIPKKMFNKRVGVALIKAGALDCFNPNRYELLNEFYDLRKDKDERFNPSEYGKGACTFFEKEVLSCSVTYVPQWDMIADNSAANVIAFIKKLAVRPDKSGKDMAFMTLEIDGDEVKGLMFARDYNKKRGLIREGNKFSMNGRKDDKGAFLVNNVMPFIDIQMPAM